VFQFHCPTPVVSEPINCLSEEEDFIYIAPFHSSRLQFVYTPTHTLSKIQVRYVLVESIDEILRSARGNEFYNLGALTLNYLPPTVDNRIRGGSVDLRDQQGGSKVDQTDMGVQDH